MCYFLGSLFTDWASGCYVRCGCIGSPAFQFSGGWGGVGVRLEVGVGLEVGVCLSTCSLQSVTAFCLGSECINFPQEVRYELKWFLEVLSVNT